MMNRKFTFLIFGLLVAAIIQAQTASYTKKWEVKTPFVHNVFIENRGQIPGEIERKVKEPILYYSIKGSVYLFFSPTSVTFLTSKFEKADGDEKEADRDKTTKMIPEYMSMSWLGANANVQVTVDKESTDYFTYPNPNTENKLPGITAHAWSKVTYHNLYNGIDVVFYYPDKGGIEYDIIVHPGADPSVVKMNYTGAKTLLKSGNILITSDCANLTDHAPSAKDENGSNVATSFSLDNNTVSFKTGTYNRSQTLTIDPWVTATSFTTTNSAYDIGYDVFGNVYIFGGGTSTVYQLQKYNSTGTLQWTYSPSTWPEGGSFWYYYGDLVTDTRTGDCYINAGTDGGFSISGAQINKVGPAGNLIRNYSGNSKIHEAWRMDLDYCHNLLVIGAGDAGSPPYQAFTIDTAFASSTAVNVLGTDSAFHDMALLGLDQLGHAYMATSQTAGGSAANDAIADNVLMQLPIPSLSPTAYQVSDGYTFQEISSISYLGPVLGGSAGNGLNGLAANKYFVITYDGSTVKKWTTTGVLKKTIALPGGKSFGQGGLDLDCQGHIYAGNGSAIDVYDSTLASLGTVSVANTVYDLKVASNGLVYACGKTFVGAYTNTYSSKMVTISSTAPSACAACDGKATANVSCGSGNYTYKWSNGATTSSITNLCQGIYSVTVTDASKCGGAGGEDTASVKFVLPGGPTVSITSKTATLCNGGGGGTATANATGGSGPYTYSWSPSGQTNATATNLSEGTYTVTVKNGSGCISVDTVNISQPAQIQIGTNISPTCSGNNGSIAAIVSGGVGPYTYSWAPSGGTNATASGLGVGTYTVTVQDKNGCTQTQTATIGTASGTPPTVTPSETPASCSICNGTASVSVSGGTAPYTYSWSNGATASSQSNLCGGTYSVSVSSAGDSVVVPFYTENFTGGALGGWTLNIPGTGTPGTHPNKWVVDNNTPLCNTGGYYLHIACSGTNAYYTCNPGATYDPGVPNFDNSATDLYASSPSISTVGKNNMTLEFTYESDGNSSADYGLVSFSSNGGTTWNDQPTKYSGVTTCTKASVAIPATYNGIANFRVGFRWINVGKGKGNDPPFAIDSISIGSKAFVTGCPTTQTIVIPPSGSFSVTTTPTNASCGSNNGSATVTPTPTGAYTYKWSDGQTTQTATSLSAGTYTVIVSVSGGCSDTTQVTVSNSGGPTLSSISRTDVVCYGTNTGTATANVTGGVSPFTYSWNSGQSTSSVNALNAGTYTCTVTDKNGCKSTDTVIITQPVVISSSVSGTTQASCGSSNGSATITASGGTGTLTYSWAPSGGTAAVATSLAAGTYTCTITDANGCTKAITATVSNSGGPTVNTTSTSPKCNGQTGIAVAAVSGGVNPYTYSWSPTGGSKDTATGLIAGLYTCTVTDKNGCITSDTIRVNQPSAITGSANTTNASCGNSDGSATILAAGGTGALTYSWSPSGATTNTLGNLAAGSYTCTVTDGNGCSNQIVALISNIGAPTLAITQSNEKCFGDKTGTAIANASGGSSPYAYSWNNGATTSSINGLAAGTYTCVVTDNKGCITNDTVKITQPSALASTVKIVAATCGKPGTATITPVGGTSPYSYKWSPSGGTSATASNLASGSYTCTITDADSCTQVLPVTVTGNSGPVVSISPDTTIALNGTATITATGGGKYVWSPATSLTCSTCATTNADPTKTTTYCVLVTDTSGCADSACMVVNVELPCGQIWVPNAFSPNGDNQNDLECVYGNCIETISFRIFDRWGNEVFETVDPKENCWDGKYKGQLMNSGIFVYYLDAVLTSGEKVSQKGNITLVR
ncbi:MAG TPA: gliding motility-associated C-terminal domain-containing protein [Bacteroidia bacterium]|nr:gliding motility-associated C-terminal domain-containing protein [Bacteroidia bacterium]